MDMLAKLFLAAFGFSFWLNTCTTPEKKASGADQISTDTVRLVSVDFTKDIQPILQSHCMPCHFDGGKMYARMPFDQPKTILDHSDGILRRIKGPDEVKKLKAFLAAQAK